MSEHIARLALDDKTRTVILLVADALEEVVRTLFVNRDNPSYIRSGFEQTSYSISEAHLSTANEFVQRPIAFALRRSIPDIGRLVFKLGGHEAMMAMLNTMVDRFGAEDPDLEVRTESLLDKGWNGIGEWSA